MLMTGCSGAQSWYSSIHGAESRIAWYAMNDSISMSPMFQHFRCKCQWTLQHRSLKPYGKTLLKFIFRLHGSLYIGTRTANFNFQRQSHCRLWLSHRLIFIINNSRQTCKLKFWSRRSQSHRQRNQQSFNFFLIFMFRCHKELHLWSRTMTSHIMTFDRTFSMRHRSLHLLNT